MQKQRKFNIKSLCIRVALVTLLLALTSFSVFAASGTCGQSLEWSLDSSGTLTVSGTGTMWDYTGEDSAPWYNVRESVEKIVISDGVTTIGNAAFYDFSNLTTVAIADTVTRIGNHAFQDCVSLKTVTLSQNLEEIGENAFNNCTSLLKITLPNGLESIGYQAFYRCESLVSITIPSTVTYMGSSIFAYCYDLVQANIYANISELPRWTFYGCSSLVSITASENLETAGVYAFEGCTSLSQGVIEGEFPEVGKTTTTVSQDNAIETSTTVTENNNSTIITSVATDLSTKTVEVTTQAVVDSTESLETVVNEIVVSNQALIDSEVDETKVTATAEIHLISDDIVDTSVIEEIANTGTDIKIHTTDGAIWEIVSSSVKTSEIEQYDMSFVVQRNYVPTPDQLGVLGEYSTSYTLKFNGSFDFNATIYVPLDSEFAFSNATLYQNVDEETGFSKVHSIVIDKEGYATFYLGGANSEIDYLIGITNESTISAGAIIPTQLYEDYGGLVDEDGVQYVVTGERTSELSFGLVELTIGVVGIMILCVIIIGTVMLIMNKRSLQKLNEERMREET